MNRPFLISVFLCLMAATSVWSAPAPLLLKAGPVDREVKSTVQLQSLTPSRGGYYILQFSGTPRPEWKASLQKMGVKLRDYLPENAYIARLKRSQIAKVRGLACIAWMGRLHARYRIDPHLKKKTQQKSLTVLIRVFGDEAATTVIQVISASGGELLRDSDVAGGILLATIPARALDRIAGLEEVRWIEEWAPPRAANNVVQSIIGVTPVRNRTGLFGAGEIISFADSGLDTGNLATLSPDLAGRVIKTYALRRPDDWSDLSGHGTFCVSVAAGSGALSGSNAGSHTYTDSFCGVAPEASIIMQSIGDGSSFVYPPVTLSQLFQPPYLDGARVQNHSWGSPVEGKYTTLSQQVDDFVWNHKDAVLVFPVGNDGVDANADGRTDSGALYSPATAKNCISVGATESLRATGRSQSYGTYWGSDFPQAPINSDPISDNPSGMAAWSSRGPCADGRIKPDICAPGTNIVALSSQLVGNPGWMPYDSHYSYWGGTSFSAPAVAGSAVLLRQYLNSSFGIAPSAALVKAALLNSAKDMAPGQYIGAVPPEIPVRPNSVEGWGRVDVNAAIDPPAPRQIEYVDETSGISTGQTRTYQYTVLGSDAPFAVTLVWTDPPGSPLAAKELVNDLNLSVTAPNGTVYRGNGATDSVNNVESVDVSVPLTGVYTVTVTGFSVPGGPQPFALVASGHLPGSYITGTLLSTSGNPIAGATVTATGSSATKDTTTGANGRYTLRLPADSYTVSAAKTGWTFAPPSTAVVVADQAAPGVDFTGSAAPASISGVIQKALGGVTAYEVESPHNYQNNSDVKYTVTGPVGATHIRAHFDEVALQNGLDHLYIEDADGTPYQDITGNKTDYWSQWVPGNALVLHLVTDATGVDYGFRMDGYETDLLTEPAPAGVTVTAQPGNHTTTTGVGGAYTLSGLEPVSYTVTPSYPNWQFQPNARSAEPSPGSTLSGVNFTARPPATITGSVTVGTTVQEAVVLQSQHPYGDNVSETYTVQGPQGASKIRVHFTRLEVEPGFDFIDVTDSSDQIIDTFTGHYSDVWSEWVNGDSLKIVLTSDPGNSDWGFITDRYEAVTDQHGVPGVTITASPGGKSALTALDGSYTLDDLAPGLYSLSAAKPSWTFSPASQTVNAVWGMSSEADFLGLLSGTASISAIKALPDGDQVLLNGKIVTAGSTQEYPQYLYIEETNRSSGIRVATAQTLQEGDSVTVRGTIQTLNGERFIDASSVTVNLSGNPAILPLVMRLSSLGGGALNPNTPGVHTGYGLNNIGLLVKVGGQVESVSADSFTINDGSSYNSDPVTAKVLCGTLAKPAAGDFVTVTGISTMEPDGSGGYRRVVRVRRSSDITVAVPHP
ncbi:MAG: S8 family serine peptidase [Armatimonadetes bacterium]|nr:S8 family serine peptidase [Armatimonadota bacterium]